MKKLFFVLAWLINFSLCYGLELYKNGVTASYYGVAFHGKKTSNGEQFNMNDLTCAHKELPFNTILKVTNLANGKSVQVRVNDRGPFVIGREIDLSTQAAKTLDMMKTGTAKVKLEIVKKGPFTKQSNQTAQSAKKIMAQIEKRSTASTTKTQPKTQTTTKDITITKNALWDIQIASFSDKKNAEALAKNLLKDGFKNLVYQTTKDTIRVVIAKIPSEQIAATTQNLQKAGYSNYIIRERKG